MKNERLEKLRDRIKTPKTVMLATKLKSKRFTINPIILQEMDKNYDIWLIGIKGGDIFKNIEKNNQVQILFSDDDTKTHLSIFGNATIVDDHEKVKELWKPELKTWFSNKNDPKIGLLQVDIDNYQFWNPTQSITESVIMKEETEKLPIDSQEKIMHLYNH